MLKYFLLLYQTRSPPLILAPEGLKFLGNSPCLKIYKNPSRGYFSYKLIVPNIKLNIND